MKHVLFTHFFLIVIASGFAQTSKFGKITNEQWEIKKSSFDSASNAVILFDVGNISFQTKEKSGVEIRDADLKLQSDFFTLSYERHIRIKALINDGIASDFLSFNLRSFDGKKDKLSFFKGILIEQISGKEIQRKYNSSDLKKEIKKDGSSQMILELSDIKAGSIIDISYQIETNVFTETPEWNFVNAYPNLYSELNFSIPDFVLLSKKCDSIKSLTYNSFSRSLKFGVSSPITDGWKYRSYSYTENNEKYSMSNISSSHERKTTNKLKYIIDFIDFNSVSFK
jgi:hypothetical protein